MRQSTGRKRINLVRQSKRGELHQYTTSGDGNEDRWKRNEGKVNVEPLEIVNKSDGEICCTCEW